ncbi:MAG TPA: DUF2652 domain-containing protein [Chryseolinea sp.]|nr:DUF2652 domain-containing protein [Chryseolinea sp.]
MAETIATILIPDISGFTEFMTTTELSHSSHAINILIDAMLTAIGDEYEISEIEGDAVLLIRKGPAPSKKEILDTCLKIFNAFHFQRKWMQQYNVCPCGACQAIINLTLKFVAHYGPLAEIKVGRFVKQSGTEMIVAHRLLKNRIDNNEYLLISEKFLQQMADPADAVEMEWTSSFEEYPSIGKIDYHFTLLNEARKKVPEPPVPKKYYHTDNTSYLEMPISANYLDVYMVMMNIPGRHEWVPGLKKVEQDVARTFVGSIHHCTFEEYQATISPLQMKISDEGILFAETCAIPEMDVSLVYEFVFKKIADDTCGFAARFMNAREVPIPAETHAFLFRKMQEMAQSLKEHCEK